MRWAIAAALGLLALAASAAMQTDVGVLTCTLAEHGEKETNPDSQTRASHCAFKPKGGPEEIYVGEIKKVGSQTELNGTQVLIWAVMLYGLSTLVFGFSTSFWLTFGCLAVSGLADAVSMVIRNIIRQLETPDSLRGRMTGINMVFFMGGPQLGEVEAGLVANWRGAPFSVITGGIGCLVATAAIALATPALWKYRK